MLEGSCLCGGVRYEISGELGPSVHCHCGQCRKASGADEVRLRLGTLDSDPGTKPAAHIFVSFKAPWTTITDDLPQRG